MTIGYPEHTVAATRTRTLAWAGVFLPPLAWAAHLQFCYALVGADCARAHPAVLLGASALAGLAALGGAALGWRTWRHREHGWPATHAGSGADRGGFLAGWALAFGAWFTLVIAVQTLPILLLEPCT